MEPMLDDISDHSARLTEARTHSLSTTDGTKLPPFTQRTLGVLAMFGFALPIAAYFWLIHHYGVNTILCRRMGQR